MARVITTDDVRRLQSSGRPDAEIAATLVSWTEQDDVRYGVGTSPAELLSTAATHYGLAGDLDQQWAVLQRARGAEGATSLDVEAKMISALAARGRKDEALALADELRRSGVSSTVAYLLVASALSDLDEPRAALRWLNMGLRDLDRRSDAGSEESVWQSMVADRYHLRRQLGLGKDSYDNEAELVLQRWAEASVDAD